MKISAKGTILKFGLTATPLTSVTALQSIGFDQGNRDQIDVTTHDSATAMEHVDSGLRETPTIDGTIIYQPEDATHESIRAAHAAGTLIYATVILPDAGAAQWACSGHVTSFVIPARGPKDPLIANFSIKAKVVETFTA